MTVTTPNVKPNEALPTALIAYGRILRARWRWVAWGVAVAVGALAVALIAWPPLYRTQATVFVRTPGDVSQSRDGGDSYAQVRAETYAALARSTGLSSRVIDNLGLTVSPNKLSSRIQAQHIGKTALFQISVNAPTPGEARRTAEVLVNELSARVDALEAVPGTLVPRAQLVVVDTPTDPRRIVIWGAPLHLVVIAVLLLGATLGASGAVLRDILTDPNSSDQEDA